MAPAAGAWGRPRSTTGVLIPLAQNTFGQVWYAWWILGAQTRTHNRRQVPSQERRASQRFLIECKAEYRTISRDGAEVSGWGQTVNVSSGGILLTVEHVLSVGRRMEVRVDWPVRLHDKIPLKLVLQGQVVRSATREVALSISRYEFRTGARSGIGVKTGWRKSRTRAGSQNAARRRVINGGYGSIQKRPSISGLPGGAEEPLRGEEAAEPTIALPLLATAITDGPSHCIT